MATRNQLFAVEQAAMETYSNHSPEQYPHAHYFHTKG